MHTRAPMPTEVLSEPEVHVVAIVPPMVEPQTMVVMGTTVMPMNTWPPKAHEMLETAGRSAQPILKLCKTTGATTNDVVNSREELQLTLHGFCVECYRDVCRSYLPDYDTL